MSRKSAREKAMQFLYQLDCQRGNLEKQLEKFIEVRTFVEDNEEDIKFLEKVKSRISVFDIDSDNEQAIAKAKEEEYYESDLEEGIITSLSSDDIVYLKNLVQGVLENQSELDNIYSKYLHKWSVKRLPKLERVLLRLGTYEISMDSSIPNSVAINEIVELCHAYVDENSYSYINAVLGKVNELTEQK